MRALRRQNMLRRILSEFAGTWFMVAVGCGSIALGAPGWLVSLAFGAAVTVAILVLQPISGAHINPAVSIAFTRSGHLEKEALGPYIVAQLAGALTAAWMLGGIGPTQLADDVNMLQGTVIEVFITFALMASIYILDRCQIGNACFDCFFCWRHRCSARLFLWPTYRRVNEPSSNIRTESHQRNGFEPSIL